MKTLPTFFISHGSPMLALSDEPTTKFLRNLPMQFALPSAIIVASAHFETNEPMLTGAEHPKTIHDFSGFPAELYELNYPVLGSPPLAKKIKSLLVKAGFNADIDINRGLDHGAWNPLLIMYPDANIPVIELSVQPQHNAHWHYRLGEALQSLHQENILIIGSGNLTHNLREAFRGSYTRTPSWVSEFSEWIADRIKAGDIESLLNWQTLAPHAAQNHPTPEHFLPLFVALGAAQKPLKAQRNNQEISMDVLAMDLYWF